MGQKLKIIFMGTPAFAVKALDALHAAGHEIIAAYTQPPRPAGRGHKVQNSAVHLRAEELGIPVFHPRSLKKDAAAREEFKNMKADIAIVAAYGLILPQEILDAPKYGCLNIHASLLPRWRGAAPIQRAIMAGDHETGICIMQMDAGLDTGAVLLRGSTAITDKTTASSLHDTLAEMGGALTIEALSRIDSLKPEPQPEEGVTYAHMLTKDDGRIDWTRPAKEIERQMRALTPWPGVWTMRGEERLKILEAEIAEGRGAAGEILDRHMTVACGAEAFKILKLQPQDRKPMDGASYMNGLHLNAGDQLS